MEGKTVKWPIKVWFFVHIILITLWALPKAPPSLRIHNDPRATAAQKARAPQPGFQERIFLWNDRVMRAEPMAHYILASGFWQYWDMFAPNPSNLDMYLKYEVIYQDGTSEQRDFYRIYTMGLLDKYTKERFRKYTERVVPESAFFLWPPLCQRLALDAYERRKVMPSRIRLMVMSRSVRYPQPKPPFRQVEFYQHVVVPREVLELANK